MAASRTISDNRFDWWRCHVSIVLSFQSSPTRRLRAKRIHPLENDVVVRMWPIRPETRSHSASQFAGERHSQRNPVRFYTSFSFRLPLFVFFTEKKTETIVPVRDTFVSLRSINSLNLSQPSAFYANVADEIKTHLQLNRTIGRHFSP